MEKSTEVAFSDSRPHLGKFFSPHMRIIIKTPKFLSSITWRVTFHQFYGIADWTDYRGKRGLDGLGIGIRPTATLNTTDYYWIIIIIISSSQWLVPAVSPRCSWRLRVLHLSWHAASPGYWRSFWSITIRGSGPGQAWWKPSARGFGVCWQSLQLWEAWCQWSRVRVSASLNLKKWKRSLWRSLTSAFVLLPDFIGVRILYIYLSLSMCVCNTPMTWL